LSKVKSKLMVIDTTEAFENLNLYATGGKSTTIETKKAKKA